MARAVGVEASADRPVIGECLRKREIEQAARLILQADAQRHVHVQFFAAPPLVAAPTDAPCPAYSVCPKIGTAINDIAVSSAFMDSPSGPKGLGLTLYFATALTVTLWVFTSSDFGSVTVSTPSLYSAATLSSLTEQGSSTERKTVPLRRSIR